MRVFPTIARVALALVAVLLPEWSSAHHSFARYDTENPIEMTGEIVEFRFRSPHSILTMEVVGEDASVEVWELEGPSVPLLRRSGIDQDTLAPGDIVTVQGFLPRRSNGNIAAALDIRLAGGPSVVAGSLPLPALAGEITGTFSLEDFAGIWAHDSDPNPHSIGDSPLPLTSDVEAIRRSFDPLNSPARNCVPPNLPTILYLPYLYGIQISEDEVVLHHEYYSVVRRVPLSTEPRQTEPTGEFGIAFARIDGDSIIVESEGFPPLAAGLAADFDPNGMGGEVPSSERKRFVERYSLSEDRQRLSLEYTIEDAGVLTEEFTSSTDWVRLAPDTEIHDFVCDPEIAERTIINSVGGTQ